MPKIKCLELAGQDLSTSDGIVKFDADGIGMIESEELHTSLLKQRAFQPVVEEEALVKPESKPAPKSPKAEKAEKTETPEPAKE